MLLANAGLNRDDATGKAVTWHIKPTTLSPLAQETTLGSSVRT
jgi:hypothetical protein